MKNKRKAFVLFDTNLKYGINAKYKQSPVDTNEFGKSGGSVLRRHISGLSKFGSPHQHLW